MGDGFIDSPLIEQFGATSVAARNQFVSLLYYLGMLTLGSSPRTRQFLASRSPIG